MRTKTVKNTKEHYRHVLMEWENEGGHLINVNDTEDIETKGDTKNPSTYLWGEQTQKSLKYFDIGTEVFDHDFIRALIIIKRSMALSNNNFGLLDQEKSFAIVKAADYFLESRDYSSFPVKIWQTGSGTQINMNVNEVLAHVATNYLKEDGKSYKVHPNDHVNLSQSSNDVIPSALNISATALIVKKLLPVLNSLENELLKIEHKFKEIVKVGRTHLMDAVPISLGQEFSAFKSQICQDKKRIEDTLERTKEIPLGGTAVGTGINCPTEVAIYAAVLISNEYGINFKKMNNLFRGISSSDEIVELSGQLKTLACSLLKMATDLIILGSGPDTGFSELILPKNEAGSSIMPGKINPTQCEALSMVCCQVIGNDISITLGGMQGKLQLNTFRPLLIRNIFHSITLLCDSVHSFTRYCLVGLKVNLKRIKEYTQKTKMVITEISPIIGYDAAADLVRKAEKNHRTIKEEILLSGLMSEEELVDKFTLRSLTSPPPLFHNLS